MNESRLCIFGEVLFDCFPDGSRVLGGAPFNVAWHLQAFGQRPCFISRVGRDAEAEVIRAAMHGWGMDSCGLQTDNELATGKVSIEFEQGEPRYDIVKPSAWDAIDAEQLPQTQCHLLYHGSLALRDPRAAVAIERLKQQAPATVFVDVNLRDPWWQREQVLDCVAHANWVKLNTEELARLYPVEADSTTAAASFLDSYGLDGLILTHGGDGAECLIADGDRFSIRPQSSTEVVDTVGAGDAFASVMILGLAHDWPLALTLERAQDFASRVVGRRGATVSDTGFYQVLNDAWGLQV